MIARMLVPLSVAVCIFAFMYHPIIRIFIKNLIYGTVDDGRNAEVSADLVISKHKLSQFKGIDGSKVYIALLGSVYDVTRGKQHYGPGGGYHFFAGIDGSKAFVTGKFDSEGLVDDISELSHSDILGLEHWKTFYEKDYTFVGKVEGSFYDGAGQELPMMTLYKEKLKIANNEKDLIDKDKQLFPPCNSEWSQDRGGRVWCSTHSGGISRDWVGVPRRYFTVGSSKPRCACVRTSGPPSHEMNSKSHKNRGDLDNPNLNMFPNCLETSDSCPLPEQ